MLEASKFLLIVLSLFLAVSCNRKETHSLELSIDKRIYDDTGILTLKEREGLFNVIRSLEEQVGSQMAIVLVDTLKGRNINEVSLEIAEKINLGREDYRDGILMFFSMKDKKVRIEVGFGLDGVVRDEIAYRIIREKIAPNFRKGNYYGGILDAAEEIKRVIMENIERVGNYPLR